MSGGLPQQPADREALVISGEERRSTRWYNFVFF